MFLGKEINKQHIEVMGKGEDKDQDADIARNRIDQLCRAPDLFPAAQLQESITHIKKIIGSKQDIIGGVSKAGIALKHLQDKDPAIAVEQTAQPVNNINHQNEVNDIGYYIAVHNRDVCKVLAPCF